MPEAPHGKHAPHPFRAPARAVARPVHDGVTPYAELEVTTNYTFLTGGSHPEELVRQAAALGIRAVAIADTNSLAGIVRAHVAAKETGIQLVVGCRLVLADPCGLEVLVYPTDRAAYARLCTLLTVGKRRAEKGQCRLTLHDVAAHADGLLAVAVPRDRPGESYADDLGALRDIFGMDRLWLRVRRAFDPHDEARIASLSLLAKAARVPLAATNAVLYHVPQRRPLQDVLTCIRHGTTIDRAGYALEANGERHLKAPDEMARLFAEYPGAVAQSVEIARRCAGFSLDQLRYQYPREVTPLGTTPMEHLRRLTAQGARDRYPAGVPAKVAAALDHELRLIDELNYAPYFLTVHDLVRFARTGEERPGDAPALGWPGPILCQGRGAAANSAVCYCLGVTSVDPDRADLLVERFMSKERNEPPDIDIDFEHERREEVIQYVYRTYGRERAALTAEVISYRGRSAVRDVGKAMGLSLDSVDKLARTLDWWDGGTVDPARLREIGFNPEDRTLKLVLHLSRELLGFPRHLSQHVGGFVITDTPLRGLVPIENAAMADRTVIEWDKDDIDAMGMLKVDCLGLGMLTCIRKAMVLAQPRCDVPLTLATVPAEDPLVYDMICEADTLGVFQIESRAQMAMLPRLKPRRFYDLVIEVAIVRPGPIQGKMVHPYLRRRNGEEGIHYPNDAVREVLGRTLGVPLFQEQAMKLAIVAGGFTPGEADQLRRAMAAWKRKGDLIYRFGEKLVAGMLARGYDTDFAQRCFEQIKGFSEYGFPESHAASFALLVYVSCWLKRHHPAAFAAALINSQPMGFYQPAQIVRDAQEHGVEVRAIDANASGWDCTLEDGSDPYPRSNAARDQVARKKDWGIGGPALRLGMRMIKGLPQTHADAIARARDANGPFTSIEQVKMRAGVPTAALRCLARADAFTSLGLTRQQALWAIQALSDEDLPALDEVRTVDDPCGLLPFVAPAQAVRHDYAATGLSLKAHPMSFARPALDRLDVTPAGSLADEAAFPNGKRVSVAGIVLVRQRPATASGVVFFTIEDETGIANLIIKPKIFERYRTLARGSSTVRVSGTVERNGMVVHVMVGKFHRIDEIPSTQHRSRDFH